MGGSAKTIEANRNIMQMNLREAEVLLTKIVENMTPQEAPAVLLIGPTGIGKTEMLQRLAKKITAKGQKNKGLSLITRHMSQVHPLDMGGVGLDTETRDMYYAKPPLVDEVMNKPGPRLLLLDEIDRSAPMAQNALLQVLSEKKQNGFKLEETYVVAAANAWYAQYTFELDKAAASRLVIIHVKPKVDDWLLWAAEQNVDSRVAVTIANCPDILNQHEEGEKNDGAMKIADPRAWFNLSRALAAGISPDSAAAFIGEFAAKKFELFVNIEKEYNKEIAQVASGKKVTLSSTKSKAENDKILFAIYYAAAGRIKEIDRARDYLKNGMDQIGDEKTYIASKLITYNIPATELTKDKEIRDIHYKIAMSVYGE